MNRPRGLLAFCILLVLGLIFTGIMFFLDPRGRSTEYLAPPEPVAVPSPSSLPETSPVAAPAVAEPAVAEPAVAEPAPKPPVIGVSSFILVFPYLPLA